MAKVRGIDELPEATHRCVVLLGKFVCCDGRCRHCSVDYLRSRLSVVGAC